MSEDLPPRFSATLHRIEVHAGPVRREVDDETVWSVSIGSIDHETLALWAYLRRASTVGFGQAQALGFVRRSWVEINATEQTKSDFVTWARENVTEVLYDEARRALQSQAAHMDFSFDLPLKAPSLEITWVEPEDDEAEPADSGAST